MKRTPRGGRPKKKSGALDHSMLPAMAVVIVVPLATAFILRAIGASAPPASHAWLREFTAHVALWAVRATGVPVALTGGTGLALRNHVLRIDLACTAIDWMVLYVVAVAVVPVLPERRNAAVLIGLPTIAVLNILRLVAVALVSEYSPQTFGFVHGVVLQFSIAALVSAMWAVFLWRSRNDWKPGWG